MARLHALDGMAVLVHVEHALLDREAVERIDPFLPRRVKSLRRRRVAHRAEALLAAEIVDAVHVRAFALRRYSRATPIIESLVTIAARRSCGQPIVAGGCSGSTM